MSELTICIPKEKLRKCDKCYRYNNLATNDNQTYSDFSDFCACGAWLFFIDEKDINENGGAI